MIKSISYPSGEDQIICCLYRWDTKYS